ncbi:hypothetical protein [Burkholderia arboris]|nr:hypothetical protein [Burkholderia arboris]MCA8489092.1 hypothetical protein [Burkholderia arboris]
MTARMKIGAVNGETQLQRAFRPGKRLDKGSPASRKIIRKRVNFVNN